jgi:hypothetical protein
LYVDVSNAPPELTLIHTVEEIITGNSRMDLGDYSSDSRKRLEERSNFTAEKLGPGYGGLLGTDRSRTIHTIPKTPRQEGR